jgi:hypothetical protein
VLVTQPCAKAKLRGLLLAAAELLLPPASRGGRARRAESDSNSRQPEEILEWVDQSGFPRSAGDGDGKEKALCCCLHVSAAQCRRCTPPRVARSLSLQPRRVFPLPVGAPPPGWCGFVWTRRVVYTVQKGPPRTSVYQIPEAGTARVPLRPWLDSRRPGRAATTDRFAGAHLRRRRDVRSGRTFFPSPRNVRTFHHVLFSLFFWYHFFLFSSIPIPIYDTPYPIVRAAPPPPPSPYVAMWVRTVVALGRWSIM